MTGKRVLIQSAVCLTLLAAVTGLNPAVENPAESNSDIIKFEDKFGVFLDKAAEAVRENYTLAELLQIGERVSETIASAPEKVSEAVVAVNEKGLYGEPLDEGTEAKDISEPIEQPVYASAGGRVTRCGMDKRLGLYVVIEHPDSAYGKGKISTYGQMSDIRVVSGDRIRKGDLIGSFEAGGEKAFYYALEDKS